MGETDFRSLIEGDRKYHQEDDLGAKGYTEQEFQGEELVDLSLIHIYHCDFFRIAGNRIHRRPGYRIVKWYQDGRILRQRDSAGYIGTGFLQGPSYRGKGELDYGSETKIRK